MAEFKKHGDDSKYYIDHAMRELPMGKNHSNEDIDSRLTEGKNYSLLVGRCETAAEANQYRKKLEKEIFKYNRKGLVKTIEIVIQCPDDCTDKEAFFETSYSYVCNKVLPMGERCVITAQVHGDEHKYITDEKGHKIDISKDHLHIIAVPAVQDTKHEGFEWKLSAHDLTSKSRLKLFHPGLQKACDDAGIKATVLKRKNGDGKSISLTVKQLKEITDKTGLVIDKSLTIDKLSEILKENHDIKIYDRNLREKLDAVSNENMILRQQLKEAQINLSRSQEKIKELEVISVERNQSWGSKDNWGSTNTWNDNTLPYSEDKIW